MPYKAYYCLLIITHGRQSCASPFATSAVAVAEAAGVKYVWLEMLSLRDLLEWSEVEAAKGVRLRLGGVLRRVAATARSWSLAGRLREARFGGAASSEWWSLPSPVSGSWALSWVGCGLSVDPAVAALARGGSVGSGAGPLGSGLSLPHGP
mgnify:CR=1 FL=1